MESLANIEAFVRSAEAGGFSAAARQLGLTPAAVSRNVAQLEAGLGVRLFQRSTRRLTLTEPGERFLRQVSGGLEAVRAAVAEASTGAEEPAGTLKVAMGVSFGLHYLLPLLPEFLKLHPRVTADWHFADREIDLAGEGFDAAIGAGLDLAPGLAAQELAPVHVVAVAAPAYLQGRPVPRHPGDLAGFDGIEQRSARTGRLRQPVMRGEKGEEVPVRMKPALVMNDPEAMCRAACLGLGVALVALPHALPHFVSGALVRVLPDWYVDAGRISICFSSQAALPARTRCFVDFITGQFQKQRLARRFSAV